MTRKLIAAGAAALLALTLASCSSESDSAIDEPAEDTATTTAGTEDDGQGDTAAQPQPWDRHERCEPDTENLAGNLTGVLNDQSLTPENGQIIRDGEDTWIGASLVRPDGEFESRDDVWLMRDGALYSVTGGARENSWAVSASEIGVNPGNELAAGVGRCVVAESTGR